MPDSIRHPDADVIPADATESGIVLAGLSILVIIASYGKGRLHIRRIHFNLSEVSERICKEKTEPFTSSCRIQWLPPVDNNFVKIETGLEK